MPVVPRRGSQPPAALVAPSRDDVGTLLRSLAAALEGSGPALLPLEAGAPGDAVRRAARAEDAVDSEVALLLATSGSTGEAKVVELTAHALIASASATHERLGGPGRWLLSLPLVHVAGWQVLVRSLAADAAPLVVAPGDIAGLPGAVAAMDAPAHAPRRYASLVPTQLARALADPAATAALASLDAVLVGGAATAPGLLALARASGVRAVTTYGSTETSGGCVYDGRALTGVDVRVADDGRVLLGGSTLARGYRDPALEASAFTEVGGQRWLLTSDAGELVGGVLSVHGRLDDVLVTGGRKVAPAAVEAVLGELPSLAGTCVVGVPDAEWGQRVVALVVVQPGMAPPRLEAVRDLVSTRLGAPAAPRDVLLVDALPLRGIGKPDRGAAVALATRMVQAQSRPDRAEGAPHVR